MEQEPKPRPVLMRVFLSLVTLAAFVALVGVAVASWGIKYYNTPGPLEAPATVIIPRGSSFATVTNLLADAGVVEHKLAFRIIATGLKQSSRVQAGEYEFQAGVSPEDVLETMVEGRTVMHNLTIPEGLTTRQVIDLLLAEDKLNGNIPDDIREGELLPETYSFSRGNLREEVVRQMRAQMKETLDKLWAGRQSNLPVKTPEEALALASIVEKETGLDAEYGKVASVFVNRLRKGMPLQADPTVIYAVTQGQAPLGRRLVKSDLKVNSPYNTYLNTGLPPGPIANPGKKALTAVLNPPDTNYIFFVADGNGGHNFAVTLDQHNTNVQNWKAGLTKNRFEAKPISKDAPPTPVAKTPIMKEVQISEPVLDEEDAPVVDAPAGETTAPAETLPAPSVPVPAESGAVAPPPDAAKPAEEKPEDAKSEDSALPLIQQKTNP